MISERTLYTDGHEVTVTECSFKVKKISYHLKGITRHSFQIIHPDRLPALFVGLAGAVLITLGAMKLIPSSTFRDLDVTGLTITANTISLVLGVLLLVTGSVVVATMKDRYAVRIATAEGEKNVVVSPKKEYVAQIVDALNKAYLNLVLPPRERAEGWKDRISKEIFPQKA
jgi:hypothetical protein